MNARRRLPDLQRLAATQLAGYVASVNVGSSLPIDSSAALYDILELLVPELLRRRNPEWQQESIDGFFLSSAIKTGEASAELTGTCILISDQRVTPFTLGMRLSDPHGFEWLRIRLGEPGGGPLRISGPTCNSRAARNMLEALNGRVDEVNWVYDIEFAASR